ncbi:MAG: GGDEF domain-containing protein, partial [Burkholderiaceae bacterium]
KRVNDTYGHAVGDVVLQHLVATVAQELRRDDMVGRLGGEEFAVLLPGADEATGLRRAEALRHAIATHAATVETAGAIPFTVSLGVYALRPDDASVEACLERADAALYFSKRNGRNRSTPWSPELPQMAPALP